MRIKITVFTAFIAVIFIVSYIMLNTKRTQDETKNRATTDISNNAARPSYSELDKKENVRKRQHLKNAIKSISALRQQQSDEETPSLPSQAEVATELVMAETVKPYFFDRAPDAFDEIIQEESYDAMWTAVREDALFEVLQRPELADSILHSIQCYQSLCKIEMSNSGTESLIALRDGVENSDSLFGYGQYFHFNSGDAEYKTTIYLGKPDNGPETMSKVVSRLYTNITGRSSKEIRPTPEEWEEAGTILARWKTEPASGNESL